MCACFVTAAPISIALSRDMMELRSFTTLETQLVPLAKKSPYIEKVKIDTELQKYQANQPEKIFHKWIEDNLWIFGAIVASQ